MNKKEIARELMMLAVERRFTAVQIESHCNFQVATEVEMREDAHTANTEADELEEMAKRLIEMNA